MPPQRFLGHVAAWAVAFIERLPHRRPHIHRDHERDAQGHRLGSPDRRLGHPDAADHGDRAFTARGLDLVAADDRVTEYAPAASGDALPVATISGVSSPCRLALDASGDPYVASLTDSISEYSVGSGAPKLIATISGQNQPRGLAVDASGHLWVSESAINSINEYSATASGNAVPIASLRGPDTGLARPAGARVRFDGEPDGGQRRDQWDRLIDHGIPGAAAHRRQRPDGQAARRPERALGVDRGRDQTISPPMLSANAIVELAPGTTTPSPVIVGPSNTQLNAPVGVAATPPLSIVTTSLRTAHAGRRYLVNLVAAEGTTPTGGRSCHGRLPRGLRLRKTGAIIGTPHARARVYRFTVRVRDRTHPAQVVT
jgi:hypothetical protein